MILNHISFFSNVLGFRCSMNVLLPQRKIGAAQNNFHPPFKALYLLHGYSGDYTSWQRQTCIESYAEDHNLAVLMPSVQNSFCTDMVHGGKFFFFLTEELRKLMTESFPISTKREDTFVAGLSMGGYGAFKLALTRPDLFAAAASLSGALDISKRFEVNHEPDNQSWHENMRNIFGDLEKVPGGPHDLFSLAREVSQMSEKPRLFQCCGTEDFLYADNIRFRDFIRPLGFDYSYTESPGGHQWEYWNKMIQQVLEWLPL